MVTKYGLRFVPGMYLRLSLVEDDATESEVNIVHSEPL